MYQLTRLNSIKHYGQICCFSTRRLNRLNRGGIKRKTLPPKLCANAVRLTCESSANGGVCDVYLVGTVHGTSKSRQEVKDVIDFLKPQVVFVELSYIHDFQKLELESEFRVAYEEAMKYGGKVVLGDRPRHITGWRTIAKPTLSDVAISVRSILHQADAGVPICYSDSDPQAALDLLEKHFPYLAETLVHERDQYMSATLLEVAREHNSVVAVVGSGHLRGIQKNWKQPIEVKPLLQLPTLGIMKRILFAFLYRRLPSADGS